MANVTTELKVVVRSIGKGEIDKLTASLTKLGQKAVKPVSNELKNSVSELKKLSSQSTKTTNNVRGFSTAFKELANSLEFGSKEFKEATAEAKKLDAQLQKMEGRQRSRSGGGAVRAAGGVAATALGASVFGGVEGFVGALGGGILGGVPGAAAGAVLGATVGNLRQQAGQIAEIVAQYNSMQIALAGVSESQEDYNKSLQSVTQFSKDFLIPIDDAISQYTRLKASVVGAGGSTEDTDKAFRGMAAAILATGGNVNDFNSALVATAQVFSKGKVSAEELRQQIGERLPGAFTIFADSMGISTQELDEMLERGEVRLSSFGDFTQDLFERYGKTSAVLGSAPEKAGQRLQVALTFAALKFGSFFQKVGAGFQDYLTDLVNFAIDNEKALKLTAAKFLAFGEQIVNTIKTAAKNMAGALKPFFDFAGRALSAMLSRFQQAQREIAVRGMGVDPRTIGRQVLEGYKVEQGIGGPGNMFLSMKDREEVRRRYVEALGTFLGETTFQQLTDKYLDMFEGFTPDKFGSGLRDTSTGLDGGADGGGAAAVEKTRADISPQVYEISLKIIAARKEENELRLAGLEADLARQKLAESDLQARESEIQLLNINLAEQENVVKILEDRANMQVEYIDREDETADAVAFTEKALSAAGKQIAKNLNAQKEFNKEMTETEKLTESIKQSIESNVAGAIEAAIFEAQSLNESLSNILRQVASLLIQFGTKSLFNALPFANGGVFAQNGVVPFARGGVVSKPTLFPFANGVGLMGEAGPEAIMPLRRGPSGRLGVEASGGVGNVVVNVDASGSAVQGDQPNAKALGSAIGAAVQAEIIKQKRPGGLLS